VAVLYFDLSRVYHQVGELSSAAQCLQSARDAALAAQEHHHHQQPQEEETASSNKAGPVQASITQWLSTIRLQLACTLHAGGRPDAALDELSACLTSTDAARGMVAAIHIQQHHWALAQQALSSRTPNTDGAQARSQGGQVDARALSVALHLARRDVGAAWRRVLEGVHLEPCNARAWWTLHRVHHLAAAPDASQPHHPRSRSETPASARDLAADLAQPSPVSQELPPEARARVSAPKLALDDLTELQLYLVQANHDTAAQMNAHAYANGQDEAADQASPLHHPSAAANASVSMRDSSSPPMVELCRWLHLCPVHAEVVVSAVS